MCKCLARQVQKFYVFAFEKALVVTVAERRTFTFKYAIELKHFACTPVPYKGQHVGISLSTKVPSLLDYNCTLIFKTPALQTEWSETLTAMIDRLLCVGLGLS